MAEIYGTSGGASSLGLTYWTTAEAPALWVGQNYSDHPVMQQASGGNVPVPITEDDLSQNTPPIPCTVVDGKLQLDAAGMYVFMVQARWHFADPDTNQLLARPTRGLNTCDVVGDLFRFRLTLAATEVPNGYYDVTVYQSFLVPLQAGNQIAVNHTLAMDVPGSFLYSTGLNISILAQ